MSERIKEIRKTTPSLSMEVVNKTTLAVVSRTDLTKAEATRREKICFTLTPSIEDYETAYKIKLRFRQVNISTSSGIVYETDENRRELTWNQPLDYVVIDGVVYREVDLTMAFKGEYKRKYFSIQTIGPNLYTSEAGTNYRPELIVEFIPDNDLIKHQVSIDGSLKDDVFNVNIRNGKLLYKKNLMDVKTSVSTISLDMMYHSNHKTKTTFGNGINTGLGKGFKFNYHQQVYKVGDEYVYIDSDYAKHTFVLGTNVGNSNTILYFDKEGTYTTLEVTETGVIIENKTTKLHFNSIGLLKKITRNLSVDTVYEETLEYDTNNRLTKISSGTNFINISYSTDHIDVTSNDNRCVVINLSNNYVDNIVDECGKVLRYTYDNELKEIIFGNNKYEFIYNKSNKVINIYKKYNENILIKNTLKYLGEQTKVETSRFVTNGVDNLKVTTAYVFDDRGYNVVNYEENSGNIGNIKQYNISDVENKVISLNSGLELYKENINLAENTEVTFENVAKGKYVVMFGYNVKKLDTTDLGDIKTLKTDIKINENVISTINLEYPCEEYKFINKEIEINETANIKLKFISELTNYDINIVGITLSPKVLTEEVLVSNLNNGELYVELDNLNYYKTVISGVKYNDITLNDINVDINDIINTKRSMYQEDVKKVWYNKGKNLLYNVSSISYLNDNQEKTLNEFKYYILSKTVVEDSIVEGIKQDLYVYNCNKVDFDSEYIIEENIGYTKTNTSLLEKTSVINQYNKYGNLLSKESKVNEMIKYLENYIYDNLGRLLEVSRSIEDENVKEKYEYNGQGFINRYEDGMVSFTYEYNALGNETKVNRNEVPQLNTSYLNDLKTIDKVYLNYGNEVYENKFNYNNENEIYNINNNSLNYEYTFDEYGMLSEVKVKNQNNEEELTYNHRSKSAKLRCIRKL